MAICSWCNKEMLDENVVTCIGNLEIEFSTGEVLAAIKYNPQYENMSENQRCHDCNVKVGGYHHPGCDMEICPKCDGQLLSCDCLEE